MNLDDGFEFFGGTVNAKWLSVAYVGDDAIDTDKGYQGKMQFVYAMLGSQGHHGCEMDGDKTNAMKSAPQVMGMTLVGGTTHSTDAMMKLIQSGNGQFGNVVM